MSIFGRAWRRLFPGPSSIRRYVKGGRIPWSDGYMEYRQDFVARSLAIPDLLDTFRDGSNLPPTYGLRLDERCIEYPWVFARLKPGPARVLDAGSTLNYAELLDHPVWRDKQLHIVTLAPDGQAFWEKGVSYLYEDLRDLPIRDGIYDQIVCISTLEHIGMDNRAYTGEAGGEIDRLGFVAALIELKRVLKPGGDLLLTVPYGRYADLGTQQVFDAELLEKAIGAFGPGEIETDYFRYLAVGWQISTAEECADCDYVPWIALPVENRRVTFEVPPDGAAAARAVACLRLVKS